MDELPTKDALRKRTLLLLNHPDLRAVGLTNLRRLLEEVFDLPLHALDERKDEIKETVDGFLSNELDQGSLTEEGTGVESENDDSDHSSDVGSLEEFIDVSEYVQDLITDVDVNEDSDELGISDEENDDEDDTENAEDEYIYLQPYNKAFTFDPPPVCSLMYKRTLKSTDDENPTEEDDLEEVSQVSSNLWTEDEKKQFFKALKHHGKHSVANITAEVGTKTIIQVAEFINDLERALKYVVGFEKTAVCDFPQASETGDADLVLELMQADKEIEQASDI